MFRDISAQEEQHIYFKIIQAERNANSWIWCRTCRSNNNMVNIFSRTSNKSHCTAAPLQWRMARGCNSFFHPVLCFLKFKGNEWLHKMFHFGWPMVQGISQWLGPPYPAVFECVWYTLETLGRLIFYTLYHFVMVLFFTVHCCLHGDTWISQVLGDMDGFKLPAIMPSNRGLGGKSHIFGTIDWGFDHIWKHRMGVFNILGDLMFLFFNRPFCYRSSGKRSDG